MQNLIDHNLKKVRSDTLPENTNYQDNGCDISQSCLNCHLTLCKYDDDKFSVGKNKLNRDKEIYKLNSEGKSITDLSKKYNLSIRTIQRSIKIGDNNKKNGEKTEEDILPLSLLPKITFYNQNIKKELLRNYTELI